MPENVALALLFTFYVIAAVGTWQALNRAFAKIVSSDGARMKRGRVLAFLLGVLWPGTVVMGVVASTDRGMAWLLRLVGGTDDAR